ncbi:MAG: leucine--tRNA ligase [Thermoplasmatota archaeon]
MVDFTAIEEKWQQRWYDEKLYEAALDDGDEPFFIHFAYPGISGFLHVGHMRGFAYADMIARYKRMTGHAVCYPAGFHASGLPAVSLAKKVARNDEAMLTYLRSNGCPDEVIQRLDDPDEVIRYFSQIYVDDYWKRFGFLIDYSRLMTTVSKGYQRFITWQFHKLKEEGLLIRKPHFAPFCPGCGPVAVDRSETDISEGGDAEINEFTVITFQMDDLVLPAATLRPETIYGVTNMWVHPDVSYVIAEVGDERWVLSEAGYRKLASQLGEEIRQVDAVKGSKLIGKTCTVPLVDREVPVLPAPFADPEVATGIVMSVPAHAPYDYVALQEAAPDIEPVVIIEVEGYDIPARDVVEEMGIRRQDEHDKLEAATQQVYKAEFHKGRLNERCNGYAGIPVSDIKDAVKDELIESGRATIMREFSKPVVCRCGQHVIIKRVPDQWFIRYSDEELTRMSKDHVATMNIHPPEYREELPWVLDWFDDRACIRKGDWLGTPFPFKDGWTIEPISDSTLYPAYYVVSKYVNDGSLQPEELTLDFFDYVFLGQGEAANELWEQVRRDFLAWYPVDINLGGKEHKTVHFPVFIMNHVAIMEPEHWPRGVFVNWWITQQSGEKISKSKGGAVPIPDAAERYGVDTMRLYYAHIGSPYVDIEWDGDMAYSYRRRLSRLWELHEQLLDLDGGASDIDGWLRAVMNKYVSKARGAMKDYELRRAANIVFYDVYNAVQWYQKRGGASRDAIRKALQKWIRLMAPFTPHLAEEMWDSIGGDGFVTAASFPRAGEVDVAALQGEQLVRDTLADVEEILDVTGIDAADVYIYTAPEWKWQVAETAMALADEGKLSMGSLMDRVMQDPMIKRHGNKVPSYAKKVIEQVQRGATYEQIGEASYLDGARDFFEQEIGATMHVYGADDESAPDPGDKKRHAVPGRPAIYAE